MMELRQTVVEGVPAEAEAGLRFDRFAEAAAAAGLVAANLSALAIEVLRCAVGRAPYLATLLVRDPERLVRVAADPYLRREKPRAILADELLARLAAHGDLDGDALGAELRRLRADELVRLGFRELEMGVPIEVGRELSRLADVCFDAAIRHGRKALDARYGPALDDDGNEVEFVVIGMGKLGGVELNFSSDVDVIYVYGTDDGSAGERSLHQYFTKLSRSITAALGEVTDEEVVFRVDLRLRPEGSRGAIANSLPSLERYYESFGRPWERQAWLKARPCAGSSRLGAEILAMLRPFVYPRTSGPEVIEQVRELNERIKTELVPGGIEAGFDVKNGIGGIREVEFFVQALQLVHGGHLPAIRSRTTLVALDQLLVAGLVTEGERRSLAHAYQFLRHLEHVLQLESGRQTQRLPVAASALETLARRLDLPDCEAFERMLADHTNVVAAAFATLGDEEEGPSAELRSLLSGQLGDDDEVRVLAELGFRDPTASHRALEQARATPASPLSPSATGVAARVAPQLMAEVVASAAPDQALGHVVELVRRRGSWALIWRLMDQAPALTRLLVSLFAISEYLSRLFVSNPELTDALLGAGRSSPSLAIDELRALAHPAQASEPNDDDAETEWNALAEFKSSQVLRIGLADIGSELDGDAICEELSKVADVCLERALELVLPPIQRRHGVARAPDGAPSVLSIFALGKLGGRELGYASDLDVVFVYSDDGDSDGERSIANVVYWTRIAQRLMGSLHALHPGGRLYDLDTRLRPSGRGGLLVSSWSQWQRYHREEARLWERQALTKLRFVAGDAALGRRVGDEVEAFLYGEAVDASRRARYATEIGEMRDKIEQELGSRVHGYDIKTGAGGIIDIEFAAQFLQLAHGHEVPALRSRRTTEVLEAASTAALADRTALATLSEGYRFLRRLEHRMRIVHDRPVHTLPAHPDELHILARRSGHDSGESLRASFEHRTREIRLAYRQVLGLA